MRTKGFFAVLSVVLAGLWLTGCDHLVASGELHGRWIARGGLSLEFAEGRFTRTAPGEVRAGTYVTDGGYITFNARGHSSETLRFELNFPRLTVDGITYYHDSPGVPDSIEGIWESFIGEQSTHFWRVTEFHPATRRRGSHWVWEGDYTGVITSGVYTISARNIPGAGEMTMQTTHIQGAALWYFILYQLPVHVRRYFDWDALQPPMHTELWWFTLAEARMLFVDAANRSYSLASELQIMNASTTFFGSAGAVDYFCFTIEEDVEIHVLAGDEVGIRDLLTMRSRDGSVVTFFRQGEYSIVPFSPFSEEN